MDYLSGGEVDPKFLILGGSSHDILGASRCLLASVGSILFGRRWMDTAGVF